MTSEGDADLELIQQAHDITPLKGSARQLDGTPADLTKPLDYPVEALCIDTRSRLATFFDRQ